MQGFTGSLHKKGINFYFNPYSMMKTAYFAIFALLLLSVRADDAEKLGFKCPVNSKFLKERIDAKKYERQCLSTLPCIFHACTLAFFETGTAQLEAAGCTG